MLQERNEQIWDIERIFYSERCGREWAGESSRSIEAKWGNGKGINLLLTFQKTFSTRLQGMRHTLHFFLHLRRPELHKWCMVKPGFDLRNLSSPVEGHCQACSTEISDSPMGKQGIKHSSSCAV